MTTLHRPVNRVTTDSYRGRRLIVTLLAGDLIQIRESGRHKALAVPVEWLWLQMNRREAERIVIARKSRKRRAA